MPVPLSMFGTAASAGGGGIQADWANWDGTKDTRLGEQK